MLSEVLLDLWENPALRDILSTAIGAFLGAWFAFKLEQIRRRSERRRESASSGSQVLLDLNAQMNRLVDINRYLDERRSSNDRWRRLPWFVSADEPSVRLNRGSLSFLLKSETPQLIEKLDSADRQFAIALEVLRLRNETMTQFTKRVAKLEHDKGQLSDDEETELALGRDLVGRLRSLTDELYGAVERAMSQNADVYRDLRLQLLRQFPKQWFTDRKQLAEM